MQTDWFDYELPPERIAQIAVSPRDHSRLMVISRSSGRIDHRRFRELPAFLAAGDVLVLNDSRVIPARCRGQKWPGGGAVEILLVEENQPNDWWVLLKPGKRVRAGTRLRFASAAAPSAVGREMMATVLEKRADGLCRLRFETAENLLLMLDELGEVPLPPYIQAEGRDLTGDRERYQTVYAREAGSVAAPTAGLHFTPELLDELRARHVRLAWVTLHVGMGTFAPVKSSIVTDHVMHAERYWLPSATADLIADARREGRRVVAVGTTSLRVLESAADGQAGLRSGPGVTRLFVYPPWSFRVVDALVTNFHLPRSTLLMLVSAFAAPGGSGGRDLVLRAYAEAVRQQYRFFSYGDAMLLHD
jgi:S-adenosylmethionine:tRNA ribosyltransferase-isomerase